MAGFKYDAPGFWLVYNSGRPSQLPKVLFDQVSGEGEDLASLTSAELVILSAILERVSTEARSLVFQRQRESGDIPAF